MCKVNIFYQKKENLPYIFIYSSHFNKNPLIFFTRPGENYITKSVIDYFITFLLPALDTSI